MRTAAGGQEALLQLALRPASVVVSDCRMPGMTGTEFLARVRELYPASVRIMLSAHSDLESVTDCVNRGAVYKILAKPWSVERLLADIRGAFLHHEQGVGRQSPLSMS